MKKLMENKSSKATKVMIAAVAVVALAFVMVISNSFFASGTIQVLITKVGDIFKDIYAGLLGVVSIIAAAIIAWCFVVKMLSKNPRSIDEATQWMKRVAICWLCFMLISIAFRVGLDIVSETQANTATPWA